MQKNISLLILLCAVQLMFAQKDSLPSIQPTVMVVPFAKEGESMRWVFEHDYSSQLRVAVANVKDGLAQKGIQTVDFRATLKQLGNDEAMALDQQKSIKQKVIELSGADIYVETEAQVILTPTGNSVTVILSAYDAFTGQSLVNKLGHSPKFYTSNYEKLTQKAIDSYLDDFSTELSKAFAAINTKGRAITLNIGINENSEIDMDSELGSEDLLSDIIENWVEENAFESYYHLQGITATKMIFDSVRIPAKDEVSGKNYSPSRFAAQFRKFLIGLGLDVTRDVQGNKVFITISG